MSPLPHYAFTTWLKVLPGDRPVQDCTLILTEGDSAKSLAVAGLSILGRDHYGVYPLKGKLLNVRDATHRQLLENKEVIALARAGGGTWSPATV